MSCRRLTFLPPCHCTTACTGLPLATNVDESTDTAELPSTRGPVCESLGKSSGRGYSGRAAAPSRPPPAAADDADDADDEARLTPFGVARLPQPVRMPPVNEGCDARVGSAEQARDPLGAPVGPSATAHPQGRRPLSGRLLLAQAQGSSLESSASAGSGAGSISSMGHAGSAGARGARSVPAPCVPGGSAEAGRAAHRAGTAVQGVADRATGRMPDVEGAGSSGSVGAPRGEVADASSASVLYSRQPTMQRSPSVFLYGRPPTLQSSPSMLHGSFERYR